MPLLPVGRALSLKPSDARREDPPQCIMIQGVGIEHF